MTVPTLPNPGTNPQEDIDDLIFSELEYTISTR